MKIRKVLFFIFLFQVFFVFNLVAQTETLRMIIWEGYFPEKHIKTFQSLVKKKYGIDIKFEIEFVLDAVDFFEALRAKKVDVISPTHNLLKDQRYKFIEKELLIPINLKNVPNYKNIMPGLKSLDYHTYKGKMYAMPYANGPYGLAYNTKLVRRAPTSWKVLLEKKNSKKYILVGDYSEVNVYIAALIAGVDKNKLASYKSVAIPKVQNILTTLKKNSAGFWEGVDKAADLKGKTYATSWGFSFSDLAKQGEIWKFAEPKEGSPWWVDNFSLSHTLKDKPELKKLAEELINYLISPEFQLDNVVNYLSAIPVNIKTKLTKEQKAAFHMDDNAKTFKKRRIMWPTLDTRTRNGYAKMWEEAGM